MTKLPLQDAGLPNDTVGLMEGEESEAQTDLLSLVHEAREDMPRPKLTAASYIEALAAQHSPFEQFAARVEQYEAERSHTYQRGVEVMEKFVHDQQAADYAQAEMQHEILQDLRHELVKNKSTAEFARTNLRRSIAATQADEVQASATELQLKSQKARLGEMQERVAEAREQLAILEAALQEAAARRDSMVSAHAREVERITTSCQTQEAEAAHLRDVAQLLVAERKDADNLAKRLIMLERQILAAVARSSEGQAASPPRPAAKRNKRKVASNAQSTD